MSLLFAVLSFGFLVANASHKVPQFLDGLKCKDALKKAVPENLNWMSDLARKEEMVYKALDPSTGRWIFVITKSKGISDIRREDGKNVEVVTFSQNCLAQTTKFEIDRFTIPVRDAIVHNKTYDDLDDKKLSQFVDAPEMTLIYVWSPEMIFSTEYHNSFLEMSRKQHLKFISVVDFATTSRNLTKAQLKYGISEQVLIFKSNNLFHRGAILHFPTSFLVGRGKIWGSGIVGVVDEKTFTRMVRLPAGVL